jgi:regulator of protease activity HflC (stomatin/prohibitin superfamily)
VKVLRYEIKNITPPHDVLSAMEKQMRAEREKRAVILTSEGVRDAKINEAEGEKQQVIKQSEASQLQQVNEANGQAAAILAVAMRSEGGRDAMQLRIAEQWVEQFGQLAKAGNTFVVPANLADIGSVIALATGIGKRPGPGQQP